ncbi:hypothetical protein BHYA_0020g00340 [Botrytis hyacinthi]|uniref:Uncharacterized protein n=1 Tax=Botrytis hyacinthi TaxID=278943 RepID=A0A4Z1H933_9HELO|nr:hypothetical protein BHYA_0020g00340 [Botrytis hyacinthi]
MESFRAGTIGTCAWLCFGLPHCMEAVEEEIGEKKGGFGLADYESFIGQRWILLSSIQPLMSQTLRASCLFLKNRIDEMVGEV